MFLTELEAYNRHTNLVSKGDPDTVMRQHVIDSLSLAPVISRFSPADSSDLRLLDVGTGAGFPALILALVRKDLSVDLIESVGKKTKFLAQTINTLGLADRVNVHNVRAEDLAHDPKFRGQYDFATARAVAKIDLVCELTVPFLKNSGHLLAQKSRQQADEELHSAASAMELLGCKVSAITAPDAVALAKDLVVVVIKKTKPTPARYPRPSAQLKKTLT